MANSIPFDPGLALGNILDLSRVESLKAIAEAQKPSTLANDKLNALIAQNYKIDVIYAQMVTMGVSDDDLQEIANNKNELKKAMVDAAIQVGRTAIQTERDITELTLASKQTKISQNIESPIDFSKSSVTRFPLSFDSIKFDVQYISMERSQDNSTAHASSVANSTGMSLGYYKMTASTSLSQSVNETALAQSSHHKIEGTIVITYVL